MVRSWRTWLVLGGSLGVVFYALAEELTLTTYYPSPRGVYKELRVTEQVKIRTDHQVIADPPTALEVNGNIKLTPKSNGTPNARITNVADPDANSDVATKGWVLANAGKLTFVGYTDAFNGNLGGLRGANQKCEEAFPGQHSHWASSDELVSLGDQYLWTNDVWVQDKYYYDDVYWGTCFAWSAGMRYWAGAGVLGPRLSTSGNYAYQTCDSVFSLACVK